MIAGVDVQNIVIALRLKAVSKTALYADSFEIPKPFVSCSSEKTSIPLSTSGILIIIVLEKFAQAPAVAPTKVFSKSSLSPEEF